MNDWDKPEVTHREQYLGEYREYTKKHRQLFHTIDERVDFIVGFLEGLGVHHGIIDSEVIVDSQERLIFFPIFDKFWTRAGRVYLPFANTDNLDLGEFRGRAAISMAQVEREDMMEYVFDRFKGVDARREMLYLGRMYD